MKNLALWNKSRTRRLNINPNIRSMLPVRWFDASLTSRPDDECPEVPIKSSISRQVGIQSDDLEVAGSIPRPDPIKNSGVEIDSKLELNNQGS